MWLRQDVAVFAAVVTIIVAWEECTGEVLAISVRPVFAVGTEVPEASIASPPISNRIIILVVKLVRPTNSLLLSRSRTTVL